MIHPTPLWTGLVTDELNKLEFAGTISGLGQDLAYAVDSYLGLTITITGQSGAVCLTTWRESDGPAAGTSLLIPLHLICVSPPGSTLILYAATPGAFVDLGASLSFATGEPLTAFVLDSHLTEHPTEHNDPDANAQFSGLSEFTTINRALGVLVACGHTREQARSELSDRAGRHVSRDLHTTAQAIITNATLGIGSRAY
jgi:hypothetical protein